MAEVDLKELSERESERVEWKENVADIDDVLATICALANDYANLGGGYVVCGGREAKDEHGFPRLELPGLTASRLKEVEGRVLTGARDRISPAVVPRPVELPGDAPDRRVLVFIVPASPTAHLFRHREGAAPAYWVRIGRTTVEARDGVLRELLVRKQVLQPWDKRVHPTAALAQVDLVLFRELLQRMKLWDDRRPVEDYFRPEVPLTALAPSFAASEPLTGAVKLRNFALLLFARDVQGLFNQAHVILSVYPGVDRSERHAERHEITGSVATQAKKIMERLDTEAYVAFDKTSATPNLVKYPRRALQEAVVNALAHRDYEIDQPVRITVYADRIEIRSPGALPSAVDVQRFIEGRADPVWRNQALAYFFVKLQLAQSEGQGVPTIIRTMKEEGCPPPKFIVEKESVTCVLPAHPRHAQLRALRRIEDDLVTGNLAQAERSAAALLDADPYHQRALDLYRQIAVAMGKPELIQQVWDKHGLDPDRLGASTLLPMVEALLSGGKPEHAPLASRLLESVARGRSGTEALLSAASRALAEADIEKQIAEIERLLAAAASQPPSEYSHMTRAHALLMLSTRCAEFALRADLEPAIRQKATHRAVELMEQAQQDYRAALELTSNPNVRKQLDSAIARVEATLRSLKDT